MTIKQIAIYCAIGVVIVLILRLPSFFKKDESHCAGGELLQNKCFKCHDLKRIFFVRKSHGQWMVTVKRMQDKAPEWLSDEIAEKVISLLASRYGVERGSLFKEMCVRCHKRIKKEKVLYGKKTKRAWARSIERMRKDFSFIIGVDQAEEIYEYWTDPVNNKNLKLEVAKEDNREESFEIKCGRCHTQGFLSKQKFNEENWTKVLERMQEKSPTWINDEELDEMLKYLFPKEK
ncbi:MAG: hypothetical protein HY810_05630 [Candidatus Omnitrophica bacterium]|nr:hypothetical protein [Candidatus Omnitrophota bacterium]